MRANHNYGARGNVNDSSSSAAIQDTRWMGAACLLTTSEEELCEYLITKYQNQFPLSDDRKQEFQQDHRLLADTIRHNIVKRKANFFSRPGAER